VLAGANKRTIVLGVLAAIAYYALLSLITPALPHASIPAWWQQVWPSPAAAVQTWFGLMDVIAAAAAALPVAVLLAWRIQRRAMALGLAIGVVVGLYVLVGSTIEYGTKAAAVVAGAVQFVAIALALPAFALVLVRGKGFRK
jgi:hypothetical protein